MCAHFQGDLVRKMKEEGAPENDLLVAVTELKARKRVLDEKVCLIERYTSMFL